MTVVINRQDFGLKLNKLAEGVAAVGDEVTIRIDLQMAHRLAAAKK